MVACFGMISFKSQCLNDELEKVWTKAAMVYFSVLF
jgi:hypothetical protein